MSKKRYSVRTAAVAATERRARRSGVAVAASGSGSSYSEIYGDIAGKLDREVFASMFERVSDGVDADGVERWYIRAKASLVSVGELTAYGLNGSAGDGTGPGAGVTDLRSLDDVILTDPKAGQILKYDGKHWINGTVDTGLDEAALAAYLATNRYAKTSDIPSLVGYATQTWVEGKSYATEAWVNAKGYLTQHQDISHLLTREEFEEMFARVDMDNGQWYILAKSHLASVGDITAYGTGGPGSTLGGIGDVTLGSLMAGDVIMWDGQKWVNGQAPGGGLDVEQLAAYLTANNYITQADLGNYVTVDGGQTITGGKRFAAADTNFTQRITVNGDFDTGSMIGFPSIMWHVPNRRYTKVVMDTVGSLHIMDGGATVLNGTHYGIVASQFVRNGGTASQFLKADGSVDDTSYFRHRRDIAGLNIDSAITAGGIYEINKAQGTLPFASDWHQVFDWDTGDAGYRVQMCTGYINNSSMYFRHKYLSKWQPWREILDSANYAGILDSRYVNKAGDTMTGLLQVMDIMLGYGNEINTSMGRLLLGYRDTPDGIVLCYNNAPLKYGSAEYTIWHAGNDGSGSGLDADLLDGYHHNNFVHNSTAWWNDGETIQDWAKRIAWNPPSIYTETGWGWASNRNLNVGGYTIGSQYYMAIDLRTGSMTSTWSQKTIMFIPTYTSQSMIYLAQMTTSATAGAVALSIKRYADYETIINSNVASATKLQTARSLWGQNFDGTGNVSGDLNMGAAKIYGTKWHIRSDSVGTNFGMIVGDTYGNSYGHIAYYQDHFYICNYKNNVEVAAISMFDDGHVKIDGSLVADGDITAYSDARLKSDIRPLTNRGFITPRTYIKDGKRCIGFLAQEVQQRYPELVMDTGGADHWLSLNYGNLVAVLEAQIIDHEDRIKRLEARI